MSLLDHLVAPGAKRILALDGGGIRGAITLGFLARIEALLRERHDRGAAAATVVDDTGREIQYGVEAAHLPAAFDPWR